MQKLIYEKNGKCMSFLSVSLSASFEEKEMRVFGLARVYPNVELSYCKDKKF
jgi:hypothetical protein